MTDELRHYRRWFYAAAIYNAVWGTAVVLFPGTLLQIAGMNTTGALPLVQVIGMMVGVYAYGYYLLARDPKRYCGLIWIALAGKTFGPAGIPLQRGDRSASLELRLDLPVQRRHLVAGLLAVRGPARPRARDLLARGEVARTLLLQVLPRFANAAVPCRRWVVGQRSRLERRGNRWLDGIVGRHEAAKYDYRARRCGSEPK